MDIICSSDDGFEPIRRFMKQIAANGQETQQIYIDGLKNSPDVEENFNIDGITYGVRLTKVMAGSNGLLAEHFGLELIKY